MTVPATFLISDHGSDCKLSSEALHCTDTEHAEPEEARKTFRGVLSAYKFYAGLDTKRGQLRKVLPPAPENLDLNEQGIAAAASSKTYAMLHAVVMEYISWVHKGWIVYFLTQYNRTIVLFRDQGMLHKTLQTAGDAKSITKKPLITTRLPVEAKQFADACLGLEGRDEAGAGVAYGCAS